MEVSFKSVKLKKLLCNPLKLQRDYGDQCNKICSRLTLLSATNSIQDLKSFSFLELCNFESDSWEMKVSKNLKFIFCLKEYNDCQEIIILELYETRN